MKVSKMDRTVQSQPQSLPPTRAVSDVDCKCYSCKRDLFGHRHCGSDSLRGPGGQSGLQL